MNMWACLCIWVKRVDRCFFSISFIIWPRICMKGCWSPKANAMTKWIKCKATNLNKYKTNIESKKNTKIKLVNCIDLSSGNWIISKKQTKKQKQCTLQTFVNKRNRKRVSSSLLQVPGEGVLRKRKKKNALTFLLAAPSYSPLWAKQFDTSFCSQPGSAGFLTHPEQKAIPLTKYLAQIFVKIEWIAARELSSNHYMNISFPGH